MYYNYNVGPPPLNLSDRQIIPPGPKIESAYTTQLGHKARPCPYRPTVQIFINISSLSI
jgi:hypothetical protein